MRNIILLLLITVVIRLNGFAQDHALPQNGPSRTYFQNRIISEEINYRNGVPFGKKFKRQENGLISVIWDYRNEESYMQLIFHHKQENTKFDTLYFISAPKDITMEYFVPYQLKLIDSISKNLMNKKLDRFYLNQLKKLESLKPDKSAAGTEIPSLSKQLNFLTYKYISLLEDYPEYTANDDSLTNFKKTAEEFYKIKIPEVYETNLADFAGRISRYQEIDSLEAKYLEGFKLVKTLNVLEPQLRKVIQTDSSLKVVEEKLLANYSGKVRYSVLYMKKIKPLLDLRASNRQEFELEKRIHQGSSLLKSLSIYLEKYNELNKLDSLIIEKEKEILGDFSKNYQGFFKSDLSYYSGKGEDYDQSDSLQLKMEAGNFYIKELKNLKSKYDTLQRYQTLIQEKLPSIIDIYKNKQPNIYNNQIIPIEQKAEEFKTQDALVPRISKGKEIITSLSMFSEQIDSLNYYDTKIQIYFVKVRDEYSKTYKAIYKKDVEPYDVEITKFKNSSTVEQKVDKGQSFLQKLTTLDEQFSILQKQFLSIDLKIQEENKVYKKRYPEIRKNEISDIAKSYSEYKKKDVITERIGLGKKILEQLENLSVNYPQLVAIDTITDRKIPLLEADYKKQFPGLYESEIKPLKKQKDEFRDLKSLNQKLAAGQKIEQRISDLKKQLADLIVVEKKILEEYSHFVSLFAKNKKQKTIYKKGKKAYDYYYKLYKNERDPKACFSSGKSLEVLLKKISTYAESEDPNLVKELRKLKKPDEIRKAFGI